MYGLQDLIQDFSVEKTKKVDGDLFWGGQTNVFEAKP